MFFKKLWFKFLPDYLSAVPLVFEKDDDTNGHIDFITAVTVSKGRSYRVLKKGQRKDLILSKAKYYSNTLILTSEEDGREESRKFK